MMNHSTLSTFCVPFFADGLAKQNSVKLFGGAEGKVFKM